MYFLDNKYTKLYYKIVNNTKIQTRDKTTDYFESHHILPRCMQGKNHSGNLVLLTAKEHFICHWLLTKMVDVPQHKMKLNFAFVMMQRIDKNQKRIWSSGQYEILKRHNKMHGKERAKKLKGIAKTPEARQRMREAKEDRITIFHPLVNKTKFIKNELIEEYIGQGWTFGNGRNMRGSNNPRYGAKLSYDHIEKIRATNSGPKNLSEETRRKKSEFMKNNNPMFNSVMRTKFDEAMRQRAKSNV